MRVDTKCILLLFFKRKFLTTFTDWGIFLTLKSSAVVKTNTFKLDIIHSVSK